MIRRTTGTCLVAVLLAAAPAWAGDVDGKWAGAVATPNGDIQIGFEFKADGTTLTGSMAGPDGNAIPIKDGTVDGSTIAFVVTVSLGDMSFDIAYRGVVAPAEIRLTGDVAGMPFELVVKKAG
jgi:hypothetical protein